MTREKKELLKQLQGIHDAEYADMRMDGSGELGSRIADHYDELRRIRGYIIYTLNTVKLGPYAQIRIGKENYYGSYDST